MGDNDRTPLYEPLALLLSSGLFVFAEMFLGRKIIVIVLLLVPWLIYIGYRIKSNPDVLKTWGLRTDNLRGAIKLNLFVLITGTLFLAAYRFVMGWQPLPGEAYMIVPLYILWALIQEFALQGLLVSNLKKLGWPDGLTILTGGVAFGLAHFPLVLQMVIAGLAGMVWISIFLCVRNLFPLAVTHSWLGTLAFCWILEKTPWTKFIG